MRPNLTLVLRKHEVIRLLIGVGSMARKPRRPPVPVDVKDRVPSDFLWQHHPFELVIPNPEPRLVYSGADYLLAYWLGRANGYLDDDAPGTSTRWEPGGNP